MKKTWMIGMSMLALSIGVARAEGDAQPAAPVEPPKAEAKVQKPKPEVKSLTLTGTVEKKANAKGAEAIVLVLEDGAKVRLPKGKDTPDFSALVGAKVKVVGTGFELDRKGKKHYAFKTVTSAEKIEAQPAAK